MKRQQILEHLKEVIRAVENNKNEEMQVFVHVNKTYMTTEIFNGHFKDKE